MFTCNMCDESKDGSNIKLINLSTVNNGCRLGSLFQVAGAC